MEGFVIRVGKWADKRESKLDYDVVSEANYVKLVRLVVTPSSWWPLFRDRNYGFEVAHICSFHFWYQNQSLLILVE